ncbi:hypothetical protein MACH17_43910 [Phaeobacter inhibens]|nr:hypothetical protein MACH17_43910 [Phaeobacter inhibens]
MSCKPPLSHSITAWHTGHDFDIPAIPDPSGASFLDNRCPSRETESGKTFAGIRQARLFAEIDEHYYGVENG